MMTQRRSRCQTRGQIMIGSLRVELPAGHAGWNNRESLRSEDQRSRERLASYSSTNLTRDSMNIESRAHSQSWQGISQWDLARGSHTSTHAALFCEIKPAGLSDCQGILSPRQKMCQSASTTPAGFAWFSSETLHFFSILNKPPLQKWERGAACQHQTAQQMRDFEAKCVSKTLARGCRGKKKRRMTSVFPSCRISHDISYTEEHFIAPHEHFSAVLASI